MSTSISQPLDEPEARMARRITIDAARFDVTAAAMEVGCLKIHGVEADSGATACPGNLFSLRKQA
jgi:hypothetical protein